MVHLRTVLAIAAALAAAGASAQMVKCVDANGVTHYTDRPPPGCKGKEVDIHGQPLLSGKRAPARSAPGQENPGPNAQGKTPQGKPGDDVARAEREFRSRQMDREKTEARESKELALRKERCERLKSQQQMFAVGGRVARINEKGERVYLEDRERESQLSQIKQEMIKNGCAS